MIMFRALETVGLTAVALVTHAYLGMDAAIALMVGVVIGGLLGMWEAHTWVHEQLEEFRRELFDEIDVSRNV